MKKLIFSLVILLSFSHSSELKRVESIVNDINKLRTNYEECRVELSSAEALKAENKDLAKKITELEKIVKNQENILKTKENTYKNVDNKEKSILLFSEKKLERDNAFPKLVMKKEFQKPKKDELSHFEPTAFELSSEGTIYDAVDGKKIDTWESGVSFTSNKKRNNWIQITGYFVNQKWQRATNDMWIQEAHVKKKIVQNDKKTEK